MSIRSDIMTRLAFLPRSAQRVGRVVLTEPTTVVRLRAAELAYLCDTDEASIVRFCRSVGFDGYGDLREALYAELLGEPEHEHEAVS